MKQPLTIALIVIILGALVWLVLRQTSPSPQTNTAVFSNTPATQNISVANSNVNSTDRIVRGPYPKDADGCTVIDLRGKPPTGHDPAAKTYTWLIEHPENEPCVRQTPPELQEKEGGAQSEKIEGTNIWRYTVTYQ